jgi:hypothetical protein
VMVARTRPDRGGLSSCVPVMKNSRSNRPPRTAIRLQRAITAVTTRLRFISGDSVMCRLADDCLAPNPGVLGDLPEV